MKNKEQSEKKGYLKFFAVILTAAVLGGAVGFLSVFLGKNLADISRILENAIRGSSAYILIVIGVLGSAVNACLVGKAKRDIRGWNPEDEEQTERLERFNNRGQAAISVLVIVNLLMGFISFSGTSGGKIFKVENVLGLVCFVLYALWSAFAVNILVGCMKKMNPEKRGNALSLQFDKEWLKSCDEQEKARMYEASYKVYIGSQKLYGGLLLFLLIISTGIDVGVLPFFAVGFIWIVQTVIYYRSYEKI